MNEFMNYEKNELIRIRDAAKKALDEYTKNGLSLDITRGKPSSAQLDMTEGFLTVLKDGCDCVSEDGTDCRNYGVMDGIPEIRNLLSELYGIPSEYIIMGGNSSLNLMFDAVARCMMFGSGENKKPWKDQGDIKFLCPSPGYDRHFSICETFGIKMIPVKMNNDGPDMDEIENLISSDPQIKGIWCVPKYSNPDGITYSAEVVERFASLRPAADDFRIFWDNAYVVHDLYGEDRDYLPDIFTAARKYNNEDLIFYFSSTSKIVYPGSGVSIIAASPSNLKKIRSIMSSQTIGHDKINQIRHVRYFKDSLGVCEQMKRHADIIRPKFDIVNKIFKNELEKDGFAYWTKPKGGYFISLYVPENCAKEVYNVSKSAGVLLTAAGSTYPYGKDPYDSNLRIAPTYPSEKDLETAITVLCHAIKYVAAKKVLGE